MLSATKNIVAAKDDKNKIGEIIGSVIAAKIILAAIAAVAICIMIFCIDLLRNYVLFTLLMFAAVCIDILLPDYLFRALEKMEIEMKKAKHEYLVAYGASLIIFFFNSMVGQVIVVPYWFLEIAVFWGLVFGDYYMRNGKVLIPNEVA